ncbi:MAG: YdcF family protein [Gaiellaceae bacterium]
MSAPAVVVLGTSTARVQRRIVAAAERIARAARAETVVFSGWFGEAREMRNLWRGPDVELVLEEAAATTAQNASHTVPLLVERRITRAIVVCAPMHLPRARWIFRRIYEGFGVAVDFAPARVVPTPGAVVWELVAFSVTAHQVRSELERR